MLSNLPRHHRAAWHPRGFPAPETHTRGGSLPPGSKMTPVDTMHFFYPDNLTCPGVIGLSLTEAGTYNSFDPLLIRAL